MRPEYYFGIIVGHIASERADPPEFIQEAIKQVMAHFSEEEVDETEEVEENTDAEEEEVTPKKPRKKRGPISPEHKAKLQAALARARAAKAGLNLEREPGGNEHASKEESDHSDAGSEDAWSSTSSFNPMSENGSSESSSPSEESPPAHQELPED